MAVRVVEHSGDRIRAARGVGVDGLEVNDRVRRLAIDRETADAIVHLEPIDPDAACGAYPIAGMLDYAHRHHLRCELLDLRNSGDTAGDPDRVVGYGSFAFTAEPPV